MLASSIHLSCVYTVNVVSLDTHARLLCVESFDYVWVIKYSDIYSVLALFIR